MFPPILGAPYNSLFPPYVGPMLWMAGLFLLFATRHTSTLGQKYGRLYLVASAILRPLGIVLIGFGWLETLGSGSDLHGLGKFLNDDITGLQTATILGLIMVIIIIALVMLRSFLFIIFFYWLMIVFLDVPPIFPFIILFWWAFIFSVWSILQLGFRLSFLYRKPEDALVTDGPMSVVRHPQLFAAAVMVWSSASPLFSSYPYLFLAVLIFTSLVRLLIYYEEKDLFASYGARYVVYSDRVPMLSPRFIRATIRKCKLCAAELDRGAKTCRICNTPVGPKDKSIYYYLVMLLPPAILITVIMGILGVNPYKMITNPRLKEYKAIGHLHLMERILSTYSSFEDGAEYRRWVKDGGRGALAMAKKYENHPFGAGHALCVGEEIAYFEERTRKWTVFPGDEDQVMAYAREICPRLARLEDDGFTVVAVMNLDFDPALHVMTTDQSGKLFVVVDDNLELEPVPPETISTREKKEMDWGPFPVPQILLGDTNER